jgi:hypothetical protein
LCFGAGDSTQALSHQARALSLTCTPTPSGLLTSYLFYHFLVLGFELRAYTLSHSTSPFFVMGFF